MKHQIGRKLIEEIGCVPIYLSIDLTNVSDFRTCESPKNLQKAYEIINDIKQFLDNNDVPCDEMLILTIDFVNSNPDPIPEDLTIRFHYSEKTYEEIQYVKAINFESWLSNVGGFVGIFLGYSMMQIPEFLLIFVSSCIRKSWSGKRSIHITALLFLVI